MCGILAYLASDPAAVVDEHLLREMRAMTESEPGGEWISREARIMNEFGMHARAAAVFAQLANQFDSELLVGKDDVEVNGKSIMGILMLAAGPGSTIQLRAQGADALAMLDALEKLVADGFGE